MSLFNQTITKLAVFILLILSLPIHSKESVEDLEKKLKELRKEKLLQEKMENGKRDVTRMEK